MRLDGRPRVCVWGVGPWLFRGETEQTSVKKEGSRQQVGSLNTEPETRSDTLCCLPLRDFWRRCLSYRDVITDDNKLPPKLQARLS